VVRSMVPSKPEWLKVRAPTGPMFEQVRRSIKERAVRTVCDASQCPNITDCWCRGHATFMILGSVCTRHCAFCAVPSGLPEKVDIDEPRRVAEVVAELGLRHVVITSVTRDDLNDHGADHFAAMVQTIRELSPGTRIELLIPDMGGSREALLTIVRSEPDIVGHNLEVVERLQALRDPRASYGRSLGVLRTIKELGPGIITKSGLMLGLGEERGEIARTLGDLRAAGVDAVTVGQYLKPHGGRLEVVSYVHPDVFSEIRDEAIALGFEQALCGPLVRSSFMADEPMKR
jgi:lipoyl synthase